MLKALIASVEQESKRLQMLLDNIRENFFSSDWVNKKVTYISDICFDIYGYPPKCFFDDYEFWFKVIHPDDKEMVLKTSEKLLKGEKVTREYRIIHADGSIKWVQNTIVPTLSEKGEIMRVDGYTSDITERKKGMAKIEELNMLICKASHDLKGPLNSAKNYIAIAKESITDKNVLAYLDKIGNAYDNMEQQVFSLLNLEKLHCSSVAIKKVDVNKLVTGILQSINNLPGFNQVEIVNEIGLNDLVYQDIDCMHSILYNLISNAVIYKRDIENAFVKIEAHRDGNRLVLTISDNGKGIAEAMKNKIFDKYVRGNTGKAGSGLGLYIVKKMVEKINGDISFASEEKIGTSFTVSLPILVNATNKAA
jgi:PAS domain S-box-containing protein